MRNIDCKPPDNNNFKLNNGRHKVSICIPVYNNPEGLNKLLESIVIQDYKDYEVIVSDDSKNTCKDIVFAYGDYINVKYIKHRSTGMPGDNWNSSVKEATGEYIKMMFHDDWFTERDSLRKFVGLIEASDAEFAFSGSKQVSSDWHYLRHIRDDDLRLIEEDISNIYVGNVIGAPSATIFKNNRLLFDIKLRWLIDMDFYLSFMRGVKFFNKSKVDNLSKNTKICFAHTDEPLVSIGISEDQLTNYCIKHPNVARFEYLYVARKHGLINNPIYRQYLWSQMIKPH